MDNLVYGHREAVKWGTFEQGDLKNTEDIERVFEKYPIEAVFHFAAFAYVGELIPLVLDAASGKRPDIKVFGTDYDTPGGID